MVTIEVQDLGIGIPKDMLVKIFKRFERVDNKNNSGLGLGLYIAYQVVEAHGGSLQVISEVGKGAVFTVLLPLSIYQ